MNQVCTFYFTEGVTMGNRDHVIEALRKQRNDVVLRIQAYNKEHASTAHRRADPLDQGRRETGATMNGLLIKRLEKKSEDILHLIQELKNGWDCKCKYCDNVTLTEERIVEHLTTLCTECRAELEKSGSLIH
jgi:RNA polymerase-binding transcription factor DksA